jgi:hypothetical protein
MIDEIKIHRFKYSILKPRLCYGAGVLYNLKNSFMAKLQAVVFPFAQLYSMRKIIKREKIDLVIAWWILPQGVIAAINKKLFKTPYICIAAGSDIFPLKNWIFKKLQYFVMKNAQSVIATSSALKKEINARFPDVDITVIPVGINDYFKPKHEDSYRQAFNQAFKSKKLLCVGRLTPQKGFDTAIQAVAMMHNVELNIIGEGHDLDRLKGLAGNLNINFLGKKANKDLVKYYQDADVFILPSKGFEALGMVCAESIACGTPVVASDLDGIKDIIIHKQTGYTFREGDAEDLCKTIQYAFDKKDMIVPQALKHIDRFRWETIARQYMEMI